MPYKSHLEQLHGAGIYGYITYNMQHSAKDELEAVQSPPPKAPRFLSFRGLLQVKFFSIHSQRFEPLHHLINSSGKGFMASRCTYYNLDQDNKWYKQTVEFDEENRVPVAIGTGAYYWFVGEKQFVDMEEIIELEGGCWTGNHFWGPAERAPYDQRICDSE